MKKVYTLAVAVALGFTAFAQTTMEKNQPNRKTVAHLPSYQMNKGGNNSQISAAALFSEDFESVSTPNIPSGWTNVSNASDGGFFTGTYTDAIAGGYWDVTDHTTFVMTVDDICNCNKDNEYLTMPTLNFSGKTGLGLYFDFFYTVLTVEEAFVEVSVDGGATWTTVYTFSEVTSWTSVKVPLTAYNNMPNVMVRFHYMDNSEWGYGLAIDNVVVDALPDNDLVLTESYPHMGDPSVKLFLADRDFYHVLPATQAVAMPTVFEGQFANYGALPQTNVNMSVSIMQNGLTSVFSDLMPSTSTASFPSGASDSLLTTSSFTPSSKGSYEATVKVTQTETDANPADNEMTFAFEVGDTVFARDNGTESYVIGTGMYVDADDEIEAANYFYVTNETEATSVSVFLDKTYTDLAGGEILEVKIYDATTMAQDWSTMDVLYTSNIHDIVSSNLNKWVTLPLPAGSTLNAGQEIFVSAHVVATSTVDKEVYIGTDVTTYQTPGSSIINVPGSGWGWVQSHGAFMIRLNLGNDLNNIAEASNNSAALLQNLPNPFKGQTRIEYSLTKNASSVSVNVMDIAGKVVMSLTEGSKAAGSHALTLDASTLSAGTYFYTLNVDGSRLTKKMTITE